VDDCGRKDVFCVTHRTLNYKIAEFFLGVTLKQLYAASFALEHIVIELIISES
jgi:hypothetical protein